MGVSVDTGELEEEGGSGTEGGGGKQGGAKKRNRKRKKGDYKELSQRVQRCKELEAVALKMKTQKDVMVSAIPVALCAVNGSPCRAKGSNGRSKVMVHTHQCTSGN